MAIKEFENFEYDFAKKQTQNYQNGLRYGLVALAVFILIFTCWGFAVSLNLFSTSQTNINRPVTDASVVDDRLKEANQLTIDKYASVKIPYNDPKGRFKIDFSTPYVSSKIIVIIYTKTDREKALQDANAIIQEAKDHVVITNIIYRDI